MENRNSRAYLDSLVATVHENLARLQGAPSVELQDVPPDFPLGTDHKAERAEAMADRDSPAAHADFLNPSEGALNDE